MLKRNDHYSNSFFKMEIINRNLSEMHKSILCLKRYHFYGGNLSRHGWLHSGILIIALGCASKEQTLAPGGRCSMRRRRTKIFHICVCVCANPFCSHIQHSLRWKPCCIWSRCSSADAVLCCVCSFIFSPILGAYSEMQQGRFWCALGAGKLLRLFLSLCVQIYSKNCSHQTDFLWVMKVSLLAACTHGRNLFLYCNSSWCMRK